MLCGGLKILQHFSTHFCLSQKRHLCISESLYSFCQRCHFCCKHIIFSAFNSLSVSLDICSVSLHIYVNLIYLHLIVICGCYVILLICFVPRQRRVEYLCLVLFLRSRLSRLARGVCALQSAVPRLTPGGCFPCIQFSILHPSLYIYVPFWRPSLAPICAATLVARCCVPHAALA